MTNMNFLEECPYVKDADIEIAYSVVQSRIFSEGSAVD